jgi:hypothetical protein
MNTETALTRYRTFLLGLSGFIFLGTLVELWANDHYHSLLQMIPIGLSLLALLALGLAALRPRSASLRFLQGVMLLVLLGGAMGIYEHLSGNLAFTLEIQPNASLASILNAMLKGANPLLAPGNVALGGLTALAATLSHPALTKIPLLQPAKASPAQEQLPGKHWTNPTARAPEGNGKTLHRVLLDGQPAHLSASGIHPSSYPAVATSRFRRYQSGGGKPCIRYRSG